LIAYSCLIHVSIPTFNGLIPMFLFYQCFSAHILGFMA
jgi:hypothetical protein